MIDFGKLNGTIAQWKLEKLNTECTGIIKMKSNKELIILGLECEKSRVVSQFNRILRNQEQYDIINDDRDWTELKELKAEYDEITYKILELKPEPNTNEIPF